MKTAKLLPSVVLLGSLLAFTGCGDGGTTPKRDEPQRETPAPDQGARPVEGEGKPETNNDPGDSRVDGDSRTSRSMSPSPVNEAPASGEKKEQNTPGTE